MTLDRNPPGFCQAALGWLDYDGSRGSLIFSIRVVRWQVVA